MALNFPGPTVRLSLAYSPPLSHETSRHAVHLFSSTVFFNSAGFFHSLPSPPSLCPSVCLPPLGSFYHMILPLRPPWPPHPLPPLQPRAPSPTSPDEFPMNVKQAYKAFAAVPRSLAVLEPPQVGRAARTPPGHNDTSMLCWLVGLAPPPPDWSRLTSKEPAPCRGGLWRAVTCGMRSSLVFVLQCHHLSYWCWSWSIRPSMCGSCTNIYYPPVFILYPSCKSCLLFICLNPQSEFIEL